MYVDFKRVNYRLDIALKNLINLYCRFLEVASFQKMNYGYY